MTRRKLQIAGVLVALPAVLAACRPQEAGYEVPAPQDVVMYQINPRNFAQGPSKAGEPGVLARIVPQLDSIKSLGTNVVWIMPVYPIGRVESKNSPYSISDYQAVNPEFGTMEDFKELVGEVHRRGMAFIMDWVANHTAWDHGWMTFHKDWYTRDSTGAVLFPEGTDWTDVADLDYDNPDMRKAMIKSMIYWVREAGVDGFRCDVADWVPADFWSQCIDALRGFSGRKILMLAEGNDPATLEAGFDMNYAWDYLDALRSVFCADSSARKLLAANEAEYAVMPAGKVKLRFTTNHDEAAKKSTVEEFGGVQGALAAYAAAIFMNGAALVYGEQEVAWPEPISFFRYNPVDWTAHPEVRAEYRRLIGIFKEHPDIHGGDISSCTEDDVLMFEKASRYLVAVNVRNAERTVPLPETWRSVRRSNLLDASQEAPSDSLTLPPYAYRLYAR